MKKKLKICLILPTVFSNDFPSRPAITEIYGEFLPGLGHNVTWITPSFEKLDNKKVIYYKKNVEIHQLWKPKFKLFNIPKIICHYIKKYKYLDSLIKTENFDIVQVRNNVLDALIAIKLKKKYKNVIIFQYSFPKGSYKTIESSLIHKFFGYLEKISVNYVLKKSDFIFPISNWMKEELAKEGIPKEKMEPIPMGVNPETFFPQNNDYLKKDLGIYGQTILIYVGTMEKNRDLKVILDSIKKVKSKFADIKLLMVGDGDSKDFLIEYVRILGISNDVIFTGRIPYEDVPKYISISDICISPVPNIPIFKISSPTKLFEYMALSKPVIANKEINEHEKVLKESRGGILVDFNFNSFANGIINIISDKKKARDLGHNGYKWVLANRTYKEISIKVEKIYFKLI